MPNVVDFQTVIRAMLPKGDLYVPQEFLEELVSGSVELVTNGTFNTNIDYWINDSEIDGSISWNSGTMLVSTSALP
jgi:hypothetical protein